MAEAEKSIFSPAGLESLNAITEQIIGSAFRVSNTLGVGFLEKVYENALAIELRKLGLKIQQQHTISVYYQGEVVGNYTADLLVEECVLLELKTVREINEIHLAQAMNYLKATGLRLCLIVNFGNKKVEIKRVVL
jgi:GxxExxY protein